MKCFKSLSAASLALMLALPVPEAGAVLNAVDPGPYTAATGFFPAWYQDTFGVALELCLSPATIAANARPALGLGGPIAGGPGCTILPDPGYNPALPIAFPTNYPAEGFTFQGSATARGVAPNAAVVVNYDFMIEDTFATGGVVNGQQITFARLRFRVNLNATAPAGSYTITHPYGVDTFVAAGAAGGAGNKVINFTRDVGLQAGVFTGALAGPIGPFLVDASVPALGPIPGFNAATGATEFFIGDPGSAREVTGSPFGTNFLRMDGPPGFVPVQTTLFNLMGKLYTATPLPTPLLLQRTSYSRSPVLGDQTDVFALGPPSATSNFINALGVSVPIGIDGFGKEFGESLVLNPLPGSLVTVSSVLPGSAATTLTPTLVDFVKISSATYSLATKTLTVVAASSDQVAVPALTVAGVGPMVAVGPTQTLVAAGLAIPPLNVTVTSANGGSDSRAVVVLP